MICIFPAMPQTCLWLVWSSMKTIKGHRSWPLGRWWTPRTTFLSRLSSSTRPKSALHPHRTEPWFTTPFPPWPRLQTEVRVSPSCLSRRDPRKCVWRSFTRTTRVLSFLSICPLLLLLLCNAFFFLDIGPLPPGTIHTTIKSDENTKIMKWR